MKDIILARLAALLEEKIDPKLRAERLKRKSKAYDNRVHRNYTAQPRDEDPPPSDDELKGMAKHYGEAVDFAAVMNKISGGVQGGATGNFRPKQIKTAPKKKPQPAPKPTPKQESTNLKDRIVGVLFDMLTEEEYDKHKDAQIPTSKPLAEKPASPNDSPEEKAKRIAAANKRYAEYLNRGRGRRGERFGG